MTSNDICSMLINIFEDETLFGFCKIDRPLKEKSKCECAIVTLMPYKDLNYNYSPLEFYNMVEDLRMEHSIKLQSFKDFLDTNLITYVSPPASPKDDNEYFAEFSYKWAAINAGLGFIGKNDVFVHYKYAQKVRISCLLIDFDLPTFSGEIESKCGNCRQCVDACPHDCVKGNTWNINIHRNELINYKKCANKSNHSREKPYYLCATCTLACKYPNIIL